MSDDRARIARLRRVERVRAIEKQTLIGHAADAERTLAQMSALAVRTSGLAGDYALRCDAHDGAALRQVRGFAIGLQAVSADTRASARGAEAHADRLAIDLALAERRHNAIDERVGQEASMIDRRIARREQADLARNLNRPFRS